MKTKDKERARLALAELEKEMEILTKEQMNACKGGGDGTQSNPYTWTEYESLVDNPNFTGGWVVNPDGGGLIYGLSGTTVIGGTEEHWRRVGRYDMKGCSACICGNLAKPDHGDPVGGIYFGQLINHMNYHKDPYYRNYGECD